MSLIIWSTEKKNDAFSVILPRVLIFQLLPVSLGESLFGRATENTIYADFAEIKIVIF